ncbi:dihydrodipicolinate synthase family protein [Saccharopolyspora gregorii]|uniref:dihydrodipicolinate synthase family protein n=1 Tax=Saccharopolyspora gregorii TaxID=33914 RepID=UPI0021ACBFF9|nr:dihydrodipicolinate synthase family protein [Saccharopolyspora gregorii]
MTAPNRPIILTAAPVGFAADGSVDLAASRRILEFIAASGTDGAFVLGTTGEFPSLTEQERHDLARLSLEVLRGKRVVVHVGAPSAFQVRALIADARELGATSVAVLTPYYLPAGDEAIVEFFRSATADADGLDVYAYLFTDRTGNAVGPELLGRIAALPAVVGAKISGETLDAVAAYRHAVPADFQIFTGGDRDIARVTARGIDGVVSGVASVLPKPFVAAADAVAAGDPDAVSRAQDGVDLAVEAVRGDPERMKAGLALQGVDAGTSRMALDPVGAAGRAELERAVAAHG